MKTPEETTLNQKILDECREEVAKEYGHDSWQEVEQSTRWSHKDDLHEEAALLAMEKQAEFFRWASEEQYLIWSNNYWVRFKTYEAEGHHFTLTGNREHGITEIELYNIWREGQRNEG